MLAEGVETEAEFAALKAAGVTLFQGYYFAKPGFETLPVVPDMVLSLAAARTAAARPSPDRRDLPGLHRGSRAIRPAR